ncbi:hypothetical protein [Hymenobacter algoricola]|uniref:PorT family protein n=1 Tax=Hymenobacter algoricola TaxID=486267 RepID=A0ABP7MAA7_9BACT
MKSISLLTLGLLLAQLGYGQQTEFSLQLTSGLAAFRGTGSTATSIIVAPPAFRSSAYTINPYGRQPGLSYGAATQVQRVGAGHSLFGVQAGYEALRSRVQIANVFTDSDAGISTTGHTRFARYFINVHPFGGRRFAVKALAVDLTAGPELGILLRNREAGEAKTGQGVTYTTDRRLGARPNFDGRVRLNLTAYYKRTGLSVGYSQGLNDYREGSVGSGKVYSQVFRLGLAYRISGT